MKMKAFLEKCLKKPMESRLWNTENFTEKIREKNYYDK